MFRRGAAFLACFVVAAGCTRDRTGSTTGPSAAAASTASTSQAGTTAAAPYLLLEANGWRLTSAETGPIPGEPFRVAWTLSYEHDPTPSHTIPAALAVGSSPPGGPEGIAHQLSKAVKRVVIDGTARFVAEEHSTADGQLVATHVLWERGGHVVWFTVYETFADAAVTLAERVQAVSSEQWHSATAPVTRSGNR